LRVSLGLPSACDTLTLEPVIGVRRAVKEKSEFRPSGDQPAGWMHGAGDEARELRAFDRRARGQSSRAPGKRRKPRNNNKGPRRRWRQAGAPGAPGAPAARDAAPRAERRGAARMAVGQPRGVPLVAREPRAVRDAQPAQPGARSPDADRPGPGRGQPGRDAVNLDRDAVSRDRDAASLGRDARNPAAAGLGASGVPVVRAAVAVRTAGRASHPTTTRRRARQLHAAPRPKSPRSALTDRSGPRKKDGARGRRLRIRRSESRTSRA
jgi:hypothetical protein